MEKDSLRNCLIFNFGSWSKISLDLSKFFRKGCQNFIFCVQKNNLRKWEIQLKLKFPLRFVHWAKKKGFSGNKFSADFSKLHFNCPEEHLEGKNFVQPKREGDITERWRKIFPTTKTNCGWTFDVSECLCIQNFIRHGYIKTFRRMFVVSEQQKYLLFMGPFDVTCQGLKKTALACAIMVWVKK